MTLDDIKRLVARGEGRHLEFKRRVPEPERLAKEVVAFANSGGGHLLLGVDDDGTIVGVKDSEEEEFALREALDMHIRPGLSWTSERIRVTAKRDVILVTVPDSKRKPHFIVINLEDGSGPSYVRVEDMSIEASPESIALMQLEYTAEGARFEFGDKELLLMRYLEQYGRVTVDGFAQIADLDRSDAGALLVTLTRAGVLDQHREARGEYYMIHYAV
ncbi:MAG: ATP-binding protein [Bacteroidetes bacterium]|nr:ATP-binding protein [Bacteroidota bacterium]